MTDYLSIELHQSLNIFPHTSILHSHACLDQYTHTHTHTETHFAATLLLLDNLSYIHIFSEYTLRIPAFLSYKDVSLLK